VDKIARLRGNVADRFGAHPAPAFLGIAIISATSLFLHSVLPRNAGAEVSGHEVQEELKAEGLIK
jgi:hypothetical protein